MCYLKIKDKMYVIITKTVIFGGKTYFFLFCSYKQDKIVKIDYLHVTLGDNRIRDL